MKIGSVGARAASRFKMSAKDSRDALACTVACAELQFYTFFFISCRNLKTKLKQKVTYERHVSIFYMSFWTDWGLQQGDFVSFHADIGRIKQIDSDMECRQVHPAPHLQLFAQKAQLHAAASL